MENDSRLNVGAEESREFQATNSTGPETSSQRKERQHSKPVRFLLALRPSIGAIGRKRHPRIRRGIVVVFSIFTIIVLPVWAFTHWNDPDRDLKLTNFLAAFFPFAVSVFAAFIPDLERIEKMRPLWRIGIVVVGLIYSLILWHQQTVNITAGRHDQAVIVESAVDQSNQHADQQIKEVRKDVQVVKSDVQGMKNDLATQIGNTESSLNKSIAKVNKPVPPERAKIQFSLWKAPAAPEEIPILSQSLKREPDGSITVNFTFTNTSPTSADGLQIVMRLCELCSYASEPSGFDKTSGSPEFDRHRSIGDFPPGATYEKMTVSVRVPQNIGQFEIQFMYACKTCEKVGPGQKTTIYVLPEYQFR